jgi:hypothetical protein
LGSTGNVEKDDGVADTAFVYSLRVTLSSLINTVPPGYSKFGLSSTIIEGSKLIQVHEESPVHTAVTDLLSDLGKALHCIPSKKQTHMVTLIFANLQRKDWQGMQEMVGAQQSEAGRQVHLSAYC